MFSHDLNNNDDYSWGGASEGGGSQEIVTEFLVSSGYLRSCEIDL